MPEEPRYHLRFQIAPNSRVQEIARDLARFCGKHGVEEVVLFYTLPKSVTRASFRPAKKTAGSKQRGRLRPYSRKLVSRSA